MQRIAFNERPPEEIPDLLVRVSKSDSDSAQISYRFTLFFQPNRFYPYTNPYTIGETLNLSSTLTKWREKLYQDLGNFVKTRNFFSVNKVSEATQGDVDKVLSKIGTQLYEDFFPRELKEIWKNQIRNNVKTIMIFSSEPWIPWEMIKPFYVMEHGEIVEDPFLCESYYLTRWSGEAPPPGFTKVSRFALIAPAAVDLPNVRREAEFLKSLGATEIEPLLANVFLLLEQGGFDILHFACHGSFNLEKDEQSILYLNHGDEFKSTDISGPTETLIIRDRPFVFINACQTANGDFSLHGVHNWAEAFINAEVSGFLGTSWAVNDELAYHFSIKFYSALSTGKTIGEAMQEARLSIRSKQDATWLAYTLYANPQSKVEFI